MSSQLLRGLTPQENVTVTALAAMLIAKPPAVKIRPTLREYATAYSHLFKDLQTVGFEIPPPDPNDQKLIQKLIQASFDAYSPVAKAELPKLDAFVKASCGLPLGPSASAG